MPPVTYVVPTESTSPRFGAAFAQGCGGIVQTHDKLLPGDVALFGSPQRWAMLQTAIREGRDWYYGDHGILGGRGHYYRITKNAYQHSGWQSLAPDEPDYARLKAPGVTIQPWRRSGSHVLICPNSKKYFELFGLDADQWLRDVQADLAVCTDREQRVRWKVDETPIAEDLKDCWAVVVYSSACALDALVAGVPVITLADHASTRHMGEETIEAIEWPYQPENREEFFAVLAANQWTLAEIRAGMAWAKLSQ